MVAAVEIETEAVLVVAAEIGAAHSGVQVVEVVRLGAAVEEADSKQL